MEVKNVLKKPYIERQRMDFVALNNHKLGYEIKETESALEALGYTEEELKQKEAERIANLSLTKREVFLALYKDSGITPEQIKLGITNPENLIELEYANEYYRGNPLINIVGKSLGYSAEQLDYLFEHKRFGNEGGDVND